MAMDQTILIYSMVGGFMMFALGATILVISGKSIFFDIYRRLVPKGVDVFITNSNRQISHHYKVPKDGEIRVAKKLYITNPDKILSLSDDMKKEAQESVKKTEVKLKGRIKEFEEKKKVIIENIKILEKQNTNTGEVEQLQGYIKLLDERIAIITSKLHQREQVYYNQRRGAFFYIEGDPIPKDFHELYTEMDSIAIDNVIARSMTKDPKAVKNMEKEIKIMKFLIIVAAAAAGGALIMGILIKTDLQTIAQSIGVTLQL